MKKPIATNIPRDNEIADVLPSDNSTQLSKFQFLTASRHARSVQVLLHHSRFLLTESRTRST
jgi:hypothetical protein